MFIMWFMCSASDDEKNLTWFEIYTTTGYKAKAENEQLRRENDQLRQQLAQQSSPLLPSSSAQVLEFENRRLRAQLVEQNRCIICYERKLSCALNLWTCILRAMYFFFN